MKTKVGWAKLLLVILFLIFISGCRKTSAYEELPTPLVAEIREVFSQQQRQYCLTMRTMEEYPCNNFQIIFSTAAISGGMEVTLEGLYIPPTCITVIAPARGQFFLENLTNEFKLDFRYEKRVLNTVFNLQESKLDIAIDQDYGFLHFGDTEFFRVSDDYIWGYLRRLNEESDVRESFHDKMLAAGAVIPRLEDGHYGFFRIISGNLQLDPYDPGQEQSPGNSFVMVWEDQFEEIEQMAMDYSDDLEIVIYSARGHQFSNQPR